MARALLLIGNLKRHFKSEYGSADKKRPVEGNGADALWASEAPESADALWASEAPENTRETKKQRILRRANFKLS